MTKCMAAALVLAAMAWATIAAGAQGFQGTWDWSQWDRRVAEAQRNATADVAEPGEPPPLHRWVEDPGGPAQAEPSAPPAQEPLTRPKPTPELQAAMQRLEQQEAAREVQSPPASEPEAPASPAVEPQARPEPTPELLAAMQRMERQAARREARPLPDHGLDTPPPVEEKRYAITPPEPPRPVASTVPSLKGTRRPSVPPLVVAPAPEPTSELLAAMQRLEDQARQHEARPRAERPAPAPAPEPVPAASATAQEPGYTEAEVAHFLAVALHDRDQQTAASEREGSPPPRPHVLARWRTGPRLAVKGGAGVEELVMVKEAVALVNQVLARAGGMGVGVHSGDTSVNLFILPTAPAPGETGYVELQYDQGVYVSGADVILYREALGPRAVLKALLQVLGLTGYDLGGGDTLLRPGVGGGGELFPGPDRAALEMLYRPELRPGMDLATLQRILPRLAAPR